MPASETVASCGKAGERSIEVTAIARNWPEEVGVGLRSGSFFRNARLSQVKGLRRVRCGKPAIPLENLDHLRDIDARARSASDNKNPSSENIKAKLLTCGT
jgi:hypothetical protein